MICWKTCDNCGCERDYLIVFNYITRQIGLCPRCTAQKALKRFLKGQDVKDRCEIQELFWAYERGPLWIRSLDVEEKKFLEIWYNNISSRLKNE